MCCRFNLLLRDSDEKVVCVLRSICPLDTVRRQNKLEAASGVRCQRLEGACAGNRATNWNSLWPLKRKFLLFVWQKKTKKRPTGEKPWHGGRECKGIRSLALRFPSSSFLLPSKEK